MPSRILRGANLGEDAVTVVTGDLIEQAAGVYGYACASDGLGQGESLTRLRGSGRVAVGRGESAQAAAACGHDGGGGWPAPCPADAEKGTTPILTVRSGHTSPRSLGKYTPVPAGAPAVTRPA